MRIQLRYRRSKSLFLKLFSFAFFAFFAFSSSAQTKKEATPTAAQSKAITIITEPQATVWLDDVKRGETDKSGKLTIKYSLPGVRKLRVRADNFKEVSQNLPPTQKGDLKIALVKTTDEAELAFQRGEAETDKQKAVELYKKAVSLRPDYAEANLALARASSDNGDYEAALRAIGAARKVRPAYAEASAVEGRIYKAEDQGEKAIASFNRAVAEGKSFQPEALTGLGLLYKEKAEAFGADGKFDEEAANYKIAADYFRKAVAQLSGAPDAEVIYQFLGLTYEKMKEYKKAIAVYEEFLRVFPDSSETSAVRSFIVQLKKQMNGDQ